MADMVDAIGRREAAASAMQKHAHELDKAFGEFEAATSDIREAISTLMGRAGDAAHVRATAECASRGPPGSDLEVNQRRRVADETRIGASADVERRLNTALELQFSRFSPAETFSFEFSSRLLAFMAQATGDAKGTDQSRPPSGRFAAIVRMQSAKLREFIK